MEYTDIESDFTSDAASSVVARDIQDLQQRILEQSSAIEQFINTNKVKKQSSESFAVLESLFALFKSEVSMNLSFRQAIIKERQGRITAEQNQFNTKQFFQEFSRISRTQVSSFEEVYDYIISKSEKYVGSRQTLLQNITNMKSEMKELEGEVAVRDERVKHTEQKLAEQTRLYDQSVSKMKQRLNSATCEIEELKLELAEAHRIIEKQRLAIQAQRETCCENERNAEAERTAAKKTLQKSQVNFEAQQREYRRQMETQRREYETRIENQQKEFQRQLETQEREFQRQMSVKDKEFESSIDSKDKAFKKESEEKETEFKKLIEIKEQNFKARFDAQEQEFKCKLDTQEKEFKAQLDSTEKTLKREIQDRECRIAGKEKQRNTDLENTAKTHREEIQTLKKKFEKTMENMKQNHQDRLDKEHTKQQEMEAMLVKAEIDYQQTLAQERSQTQAEIDQRDGQIRRNNEEIEALKAQVSELRQCLEKLNEDLQEKENDLQSEIKKREYITAQNKESARKNAKLTECNNEQANKIDQLVAQISTMQSDYEVNQKKLLCKMKVMKKRHKEDVATLSTEIEGQLIAKMKTIEDDIKAKESEITETRNELAAVQAERKKLEEALAKEEKKSKRDVTVANDLRVENERLRNMMREKAELYKANENAVAGLKTLQEALQLESDATTDDMVETVKYLMSRKRKH